MRHSMPLPCTRTFYPLWIWRCGEMNGSVLSGNPWVNIDWQQGCATVCQSIITLLPREMETSGGVCVWSEAQRAIAISKQPRPVRITSILSYAFLYEILKEGRSDCFFTIAINLKALSNYLSEARRSCVASQASEDVKMISQRWFMEESYW